MINHLIFFFYKYNKDIVKIYQEYYENVNSEFFLKE